MCQELLGHAGQESAGDLCGAAGTVSGVFGDGGLVWWISGYQRILQTNVMIDTIYTQSNGYVLNLCGGSMVYRTYMGKGVN